MQEAETEIIKPVGGALGLNNNGNLVVKNRAYRRRRLNRAELDGLPKNFYVTKQLSKRSRHGKIKVVRKNARRYKAA